MPSLLGFILYYVIVLVLWRERRKTSKQYIDQIAKEYKAQHQPESIPDSITKDAAVTTGEYYFEVPGSDVRWQILTAAPKEDKGKKVFVYFHGGGFVLAGTPAEWKPLQDVLQQGIPVIYPVWTLAPLSTAIEFAGPAVELLMSIAEDPKYAGREIILGGGSAGGWCALRTLLALCEAALGENGPDDYWRRTRAGSALDRTRRLAMFSPAVNLVLDEEVEEAGKADPLLSPALVSVIGPLWAYGATRFPDIFQALSPDAKKKAEAAKAETAGIPLSDPRFSPGNGVDVLRRYREAYPDGEPFSIISFHGTADILYLRVKEMHERLEAIGRDVVKQELVTGQGMWHSYIIFPIREGKEAMRRFIKFVNDS